MKKILVALCFLVLLLPLGCRETQCLTPEPAPEPERTVTPAIEPEATPEPEPVPEPEPIPPDAKLVCLFFDDCYVNQYEAALPVLLEHNFKATFGVITAYIGEGHDLWEYMSEEQLHELVGYDMEIACHTRNHVDLTGNLTDERLREEIVYPKIHLENMGFEVKTMIYPYYAWNNTVIEYVMEAGYTCARSGWTVAREYDPRRGDPKARYNIPAHQITGCTLEDYKVIVDEASVNSIVSLVYHFISDEGPEATSTPVANFLEQMEYLDEAGFTVILLSDLLEE